MWFNKDSHVLHFLYNSKRPKGVKNVIYHNYLLIHNCQKMTRQFPMLEKNSGVLYVAFDRVTCGAIFKMAS